jgi:hypothetical protein
MQVSVRDKSAKSWTKLNVDQVGFYWVKINIKELKYRNPKVTK